MLINLNYYDQDETYENDNAVTTETQQSDGIVAGSVGPPKFNLNSTYDKNDINHDNDCDMSSLGACGFSSTLQSSPMQFSAIHNCISLFLYF